MFIFAISAYPDEMTPYVALNLFQHCLPRTCLKVFRMKRLTLYLIVTPIYAFANRADPDRAALVRAA